MPRDTSGPDPSSLSPLLFVPADLELPEPELWKPHPGEYVAAQVRDKDGVITRRTAYLSCAACGAWMTLWEFEIDEAGLVKPPVACPKCRSIFKPYLRGWSEIDWTKSTWTKPVALLSDGSGNGP